ncbi:peptide-methionine (S)-S-oxide reductase MsrA [Thermus sp. FJN-A]
MGEEMATLAGGCFWCTEAAFKLLPGVLEVVPGYAGGHVPQPTYEEVCTGTTGHREAVQVRFGPGVLPYADLLRYFFAVHDPTSGDRQGPDVGPQYSPAIFYHTEEQKQVAEAVMRELAPLYPRPIATQLLPLTTFYPAEDYHRDYFARHPEAPYCRLVIAPKLAKARKALKALLGP